MSDAPTPQENQEPDTQEATPDPTPDTPPADQDTTPEAPAPEVDPQVRKLREEAASWRTKLRDAEQRIEQQEERFNAFQTAINRAMGLEEETSPEDTIKQHEAQAQQANARFTKLSQRVALQDAITAAGADSDLMIPVVRGLDEFQALDPSAEDYPAQVAGIVAETVEKYPKLRAAHAPASSGNAPTPSNNSGPNPITLEDLDSMSAEEIYAATKAGKLAHLYAK